MSELFQAERTTFVGSTGKQQGRYPADTDSAGCHYRWRCYVYEFRLGHDVKCVTYFKSSRCVYFHVKYVGVYFVLMTCNVN